MERDRLIEAWLSGSQTLQRLMKQRFHNELGGEQLTMAQMGLLFYVSENQPASSRQLVEYTGTSKSAVAQIIDSLDRLGMIIRHAEPADRRVVYMSLSKAGTDRMRALQTRRRTMFLQMAEALSDDELSAMNRVQQKMLRYLQASPSPSRPAADTRLSDRIRNVAQDKKEGI